MRRLVLGLFLVTAGCASGPEAPAPSPLPPQRAAGNLVGLSVAELQARFGPPQFQVREGPALKLQFASRSCVLDAYLYPPPRGGAERVTHVDARSPAGASMDRAACIVSLEPAPVMPPPVTPQPQPQR